MTDTASHSLPQHDEVRHTLTVREVETLLATAGVQRSHRHVLRLCQSGMLDAVKVPGGPSGEEWYVSPISVPKAIGDLKQIDAQRARRSPTQPAVSDHDPVKLSPNVATDTAGRSAAQPDMAEAEHRDRQAEARRDVAGYVATKSDIAGKVTDAEHSLAHYVTLLENNIYSHPYVKRLEGQIEKLEAKYEAQVRRTENIQIESQDKILELQRMTTVGHSKVLADFMLKAKTAKDWILGRSMEDENREAGEHASASSHTVDNDGAPSTM